MLQKSRLFRIKKDFYNCINIAERIFVSNQTQALIDLINAEKIIIYFLSKNNKIFNEKERLFKSFSLMEFNS